MVEDYDVGKIRSCFPILDRQVHDRSLVYLDNAATSQRPRVVLDAMRSFDETSNANVHRGVHQLSQEATEAYDDAHRTVADLIGAPDWHEVVFTGNATEALNVVVQGVGRQLGSEDRIVVTELEHHSNLVPWQQVADRTGADLDWIPITDEGYLDAEQAKDIVADDVAAIGCTHTSNVLGTRPDLDLVADLADDADAYFVVDASQGVPHAPVDVEAIDCDFLAFTGHKMCGPTGIGVLWGREALLEDLDPLLFGGEMIRRVTWDASEWNVLPWKFEAGTPPITQGVGLGAAVDFLESVGIDRIHDHVTDLAAYMHDRLAAEDDVTVYGPPGDDRGPLVSFNVDGIHPHDLSSLLDDHGVAVRSGHHCAQPLMDRLGTAATVRASAYLYNTREEVDRLVDALDDCREVFSR